MPLPRTDTVQTHDLVVMVHFDDHGTSASDRQIPCPFDGFIERIYTCAGETPTSAWSSNLTIFREGTSVDFNSGELSWGPSDTADTPNKLEYGPEDHRFQTGDVIDFNSSGGTGGTAAPVTATVVLRRL